MGGTGRPREISANKPVARNRRILHEARLSAKDPRFFGVKNNAQKGKFFRKYSFIFNCKMKVEKQAMTSALRCERKLNGESFVSISKLRRATGKLEHDINYQSVTDKETNAIHHCSQAAR